MDLLKFTRLGVQASRMATRQLQSQRSFGLSSILDARFYTKKHEWVDVVGNEATVGISEYAQEALGDVVFAQLPEPRSSVMQHKDCGALESVKAASEIYSPVSGTVSAKNVEVEANPGLINSDCYNKGWLFKVTINNPSELVKLMDEDSYEEYLRSGGNQ